MASAIVTCAQLALENDTSPVPLNHRGVRTTLEVAVSIIDDLGSLCQVHEEEQRDAR